MVEKMKSLILSWAKNKYRIGKVVMVDILALFDAR